MDLTVTQRPIVIIANYRTSSSALSEHIATHYELPNRFSEPMQWHSAYLPFSEFMDQNKTDFVLKIIADQMDDCRYYREILARDCYKIRLLKRNVPEQIASYYIAHKIRKWWQLVDEERNPRYIRTVRSHLLRAMNTILYNNALLEESNIQFDETIYAEDLPFLEASKYKVSTKPENYESIYAAACDLYATRDTYRLRLL
jgi:hypothetical protein